ncbi:MAG: hypothetical protein NC186_01745 [Prevotella sp.]|nr:hypothetical protein [Prevotella sp.]
MLAIFACLSVQAENVYWYYEPTSGCIEAEGWNGLEKAPTAVVLPKQYNGEDLKWTVEASYSDGGNHAPVFLNYYGNQFHVLVFGNEYSSYCTSVTLSTDELDGCEITEVLIPLYMQSGKNYECTVSYNGTDNNFSYTLYSDKCQEIPFEKNGQYGGKLPEGIVNGRFSINIKPREPGQIILCGLKLTYEKSEVYEPVDPEIKLPLSTNGLYSAPWIAEGLTFEGQLMHSGLEAADPVNTGELTLTMIPLFEPQYAPEDLDESVAERQKGKDAYYRDGEAKAWYEDDYRTLCIQVPCSGLYRLTITYTPSGKTGFIASEKSVDLNIYPNESKCDINWEEIVDNSICVKSYGIGDEGLVHARLNYKEVWNVDYYYMIDGYYPGLVGRNNLRRGAKHPVETADPKYTVPEGYRLFNGAGIDLTQGSTLHVYRTKNGAVSDCHNIAYTLMDPDIETAVGTIEAGERDIELYTINGQRVETLTPEPGIYILRTHGTTKKILIR